MFSVRTVIQKKIKKWAEQFGNNPTHDPRRKTCCPKCGHAIVPEFGSFFPLLGIIEEVGELAGVVLKRNQGRGYSDYEEYRAAVVDALADMDIFKSDFANREGLDLDEGLVKTWEKVQNRRQKTWEADKAKEVDSTPLSTDGEGNILNLSEKDIQEALEDGWELNMERQVFLPGHVSVAWPARFHAVTFRERTVYVPNWFRSVRDEQRGKLRAKLRDEAGQAEQTGQGWAEPKEGE